jgi:predicted ester cyclase
MRIQDTAKLSYDEFNNHLFEAHAKNYVAPTYVGVDTPTGQESRGLEGYVQSLRLWLAAFPDSQVEVVNQQVNGNKVMTTFRGRGTFTGQLQTPQGVVPGNGRKSDVEFRQELEFKNDKIVRSRLDYDMPELMRQLGIEAPTA